MARRARGVLADGQMITHAEIPKVTHVREMLLIKLHPSRRSSSPSVYLGSVALGAMCMASISLYLRNI